MKRSEMPKDSSKAVDFGPPVIAPGVSPRAVRYGRDVAARHPLPANRYAAPVAGGPTPSIPNLEAPATGGMTMADQAAMHRAAAAGPPQPPSSPLFQTPQSLGPMQAPPTPTRPAGAPPGILPTDLLPDEARQDPNFHEGNGAMYAASQPALAFKYGVIRNKRRIAPQEMSRPNPGLSSKTLEDLRTIQTLATGGESPSPPGPSASAPSAPADTKKPLGPDEQARIAEAAKKIDDFDFNTFRDMMSKDIINNEEQRRLIESRCAPLSLDDLVMQGFVTQRVPIIPGKFEPTFQSMGGDEDLAIKRLIMAESKGLEVSERYLLDKFSLMGVTIGVHSITNNPLPDYRNAQGDFDEEMFWAKYQLISRLPFQMLASLMVNYYWFDKRVRALFVTENLGNG